MGFEVSIILCTVNEIENLPRLVAGIENIAKFSYQLVFVDDASTDGTREYIIEYSKKHSNAKYIFNESKKSLLIADYMGIKVSDGKYIITVDADLQHPIEKIKDIYEKLNDGYDIVVASRFVDNASPGNRKGERGLISRVAAALARTSIRSARKTSDPLSGYFGFKNSLSFKINEKWRGYKTLLFLIASNPRAKIGDVSYKFCERVGGKSKIVSGLDFIRVYLTELILVKRIEIKAKKYKSQ